MSLLCPLCQHEACIRVRPADGRVPCLQVAKVVFPVYYGAKYQCEKVPKHAVIKALRAQRAAQVEAQRVAHAEAVAAAVPSERQIATQ